MFFVIPHFELTFLLEVPKIILLATLEPPIHVVIRQAVVECAPNQSWWELDLA